MERAAGFLERAASAGEWLWLFFSRQVETCKVKLVKLTMMRSFEGLMYIGPREAREAVLCAEL